MSKIRNTILILGVAFLCACAHKPTVAEKVEISSTDIEKFFSASILSFDVAKQVIVPKGMVYMTRLNRSSFPLREGPGSEYNVKDAIVTSSDQLIVVARYGVWMKVYSCVHKTVGWVHKGTIEKLELNQNFVELPSKYIPTKVAVQTIKNLKSFQSKQALNGKISKGTVFYTLHSNRRRSLVWDPISNVTFWVGRDHLR